MTTGLKTRWPGLAYVLPFAVFLLFLALQKQLPLNPAVDYPLRVLLLSAVLIVFSRHVIDLRIFHWLTTGALGIGVFLIWIAPDLLFPGYRQHWIFQNAIVGQVSHAVPEGTLLAPLVLWSRIIRAVVLVPIIEELFWRAWLMRWIISPRFEEIQLGAYAPAAFWITAILFASEHGPYWDVGLAAGIVYNWWMIRTRSLGDCILAHAVTNGCLCAYVVATRHWEYWM
ncbi:MAG TPA: CAAX prenyl protease-related protein [Bryobacteraceae bacterium]|nr:CAAX prenyl protease-related protein [Bryobacteraceae bacterium]